MSQPPNPAPNASTSPGSTGARLQRPAATSRSVSMPARAATVVQLVQMTAQATRLQPALVSVLTKVQEIERDFQAQETRLTQDREKMIVQMQSKEEDLQTWLQTEQYKLDMQQHQLEIDTGTFEHRMEWEKGRIQKERQELDRMRTEGDRIMDRQEPVTVEVGGDKFRTELSTLSKCRNSIFPNLVRALERREEVRDAPNKPKRDPYIFIDRDGKHFKFILNYLRQGEQVMRGTALRKADAHILHEILYEVRYYQLADLERLVIRKIASLEQPMVFNTLITGQLFVRLTNQPPAPHPQYKYITAKDVKMIGRNLSGIEFNQVVFEHPVTFEGCILVRAVFRGCHFKNAIKFVTTDLTAAKFENCEGVQLALRFCFENAITKDIEFIPPLDRSD